MDETNVVALLEEHVSFFDTAVDKMKELHISNQYSTHLGHAVS